MRILKKCFLAISLMLSLSLAFVLAACGNGDSEPEDTRILWGTLSGTVVEYCDSPVEATPVEGIVVRAGEESTTTDENGNYEIQVYDKGATVSFEKDGYITQSKTFKKSSFTNKKAAYGYIAYRSAKVQGVVNDKDGNPISGATVTIGIQQTTTDSEGAFVFEEVIATSMVITATYDGKTVREGITTEEMLTGSVTIKIEIK